MKQATAAEVAALAAVVSRGVSPRALLHSPGITPRAAAAAATMMGVVDTARMAPTLQDAPKALNSLL